MSEDPIPKIVDYVGVIGSAGRKDDAKNFTVQVYVSAYGTLQRWMRDMLNLNPTHEICLVSGGAAFADHLAVHAFLTQNTPCKLELYLPCKFENNMFEDNGTVRPVTNPGATANYYHGKFSEVLGINSLVELGLAIETGATVESGGGFFGRNDKIANRCDSIVAFTFGCKETIKDGGTADTCKKFLKKHINERLYHVDLNTPNDIHWPGELPE